MLITGNIYRALARIKTSPEDIDHLVEPEYREAILELLATKKPEVPEELEDFDLQQEFASQYKIVKTALTSITTLDTKEDLDILKEAQKFLTFILRNQEKLNNIQAIQAFKEAVLAVLDEEDPELQDRVIRSLSGRI